MEEKKKTQKEVVKNVVGTRGRSFEGTITKKFSTRVVIEFERTVKIPKYERFFKKKGKIHAKIPEGMELNLGDYVKVRECRPLSKILHFVVVEVLRKAKEEEK